MRAGAHLSKGTRVLAAIACILLGFFAFASPAFSQDARPTAGPSARAPAKAAGRGRLALAERASSGTSRGTSMLVRFRNAPYPYDGDIPATGKPFFDTTDANGRRGHTSPRGGVNWETPTYSDDRVLLYVPRGFDPSKPAAIVVFFHGNLATLERDVRDRQGVPRQLEQSKLNAILVAPQFAVNVNDSSSGKFFQPGAFNTFLAEAAPAIADATGGQMSAATAASLPVVLVAYSGGYQAAGFTLMHMGGSKRIAGVVLLDALYGEVEKFADWIVARHDGAFFLSAYSRSSAAQNATLKRMIGEGGVRSADGLPKALTPGTVAFVPAIDAVHNDFVTRAWTADPLRAALSLVRLKGDRAVQETAAPPAQPAQRGAAQAQPASETNSDGAGGLSSLKGLFANRAAPPAASTPPAAGASGDAVIQLGAFPTSNEADARIRAVQKNYPELAEREFRTEPTGDKKPIFYRVRIVNLTQDDADVVCQRVNAKEAGKCFRVREARPAAR